jgi:hypothetical protein
MHPMHLNERPQGARHANFTSSIPKTTPNFTRLLLEEGVADSGAALPLVRRTIAFSSVVVG